MTTSTTTLDDPEDEIGNAGIDEPEEDGLKYEEPADDLDDGEAIEEPVEDPDDELDIINDADDEPDDEDIPMVDATENRR